ncbi:MAG: acetylxylan esterase [Planctomycetota bacterium]|nr:acetylxylan esterase [Planctomycetota bacterium]
MQTYNLHIVTCLLLYLVAGRSAWAEESIPPFFQGGESPQTIYEFWEAYDPRKELLNVQVVKQWETDSGNFQLVRYDLGKLTGSNKSASPKIAAYYGYPKGAKKVPGIVHIHGGGQRAHAGRVTNWVELGYACISINWGGKVLEEADTPNTDWDGIAAGFIRPGITKADELDHHNLIRPDRNTLYKEPHPLNSSWNLIAISARRALTFLEQRPEVNADRLGVEGHSMGGRATVFTAIDPRIKAASPSVGGSGYLYQDIWGLPGSARRMRSEDGLELYRKVVSAQAYWPHIKAPILFLGACNDFNSPTELVVRGMSQLPAQTERMLVLTPHLNHRFLTETAAARFMWMEAHLKGNFNFPKQSRSELKLDTADHVPQFSVTADDSAGLPIEKVEIYYGYARDPRVRFWRSTAVTQKGNLYQGACPVFDVNERLFAFANITYQMDRTLPGRPGAAPTDLLTVTSQYQIADPDALKAAGVTATERPQRLIDDFSRGWQDWYRLNAGNAHHWFYATRKIIDPSWMGPQDGKLAFDIVTTGDTNRLAVGVAVNTWQGYTGRRKDTYHAMVALPEAGRHWIALQAADFMNKQGKTLADWDEAVELFFTPTNRIGDPMAGDQNWNGKPPRLANLRWKEGTFIPRPHPHQPRGTVNTQGRLSFEDEFQSAIEDSVELERLE